MIWRVVIHSILTIPDSLIPLFSYARWMLGTLDHPNNRCKLRGEHSNAWHTNAPMAPPPHPISRPLLFLNHLIFGYTPKEKAGFERSLWFRNKGNGYFRKQVTQPQTLRYELAGSPVGLLAWIYEKLYWFSRAGPAASVCICFEINKAYPNLIEGATENATIPMGYSYFPKEIVKLPTRWLRAPNLVFESDHTSGGHFAAHEKPKELVDDLRKMFGKGGPAFGVVHGRSGYDPQSRL
ncbi:hypothetical protein BDQ12DRAFT_720505 [Crucibulum laeve]|uniref:Alpha/Beta hydrolase protein n=1 Tax=Crucibulum laeve TaxID=68775 RepID=A0A5C3M8M7_9AGAR|nr:hypothetical protein BDQ12DRAFT_720505 [Crucibulum laeve]